MAFEYKPANPLPTGDYQTTTTSGETFTSGDLTTGYAPTAGEVLSQAEGTWLYMFPILHKYYKHLNYLLFDYNKPGQRSLKSKFLPIEGTMTTDGKSITWYDYSMFDIETTIAVESLASTTITAAKTDGYEIGDTILVTRGADGVTASAINEKRVITAVTDGVSLTVNSALDQYDGDKIVRAFYVQEAQTEITRGASTWNYEEYKSFFQTFARTLSFEKSQLNRSYFFEKSAKEYVSSLFSHNMNILLQEFNKALYLGWNVPGAKSEMLGIDTAIEKAALTDPEIKVNFSGMTDDQKVVAFMDAIEKASASGATTSGEVITVVCNRKFMSSLGRLKKDDIIYNDMIKEIDYEVIKFKNMFGNVEVIWDPMLDTLSQATLAYMLPKSLITLKFRQNQVVTDERGSIEAAKGEITVGRKIDNIPDVSEFHMYFEAALVLGGLSSGAYLKLENF